MTLKYNDPIQIFKIRFSRIKTIWTTKREKDVCQGMTWIEIKLLMIIKKVNGNIVKNLRVRESHGCVQLIVKL